MTPVLKSSINVPQRVSSEDQFQSYENGTINMKSPTPLVVLQISKFFKYVYLKNSFTNYYNFPNSLIVEKSVVSQILVYKR